MMKANKETIQRIALHTMFCMLMLLTPIMFVGSDDHLSLQKYCAQVASPLALLLVFYMNYLFLAPKFLLHGKRAKFFLINIVVICALGMGVHMWMERQFKKEQPKTEQTERRRERRKRKHRPGPSFMFFFLRDIFNFSLAATTATAIILAGKWTEAEKARREAEAARTEAQLKNLRSQINPHFLLNTLNNIYALTAFDQDKAQDAIIELSKLLRHVLYDNQAAQVPLKDEVQFIHSYVKLMKMRLPTSVEVTEKVDIPEKLETNIAPLIFISLIENAFKHGISPTEKSFIHIDIHADRQAIVCCIENSNHPKTQADRSGHGIGLMQVERRLELSYPGRYEWEKGIDNNVYKSQITIYDTDMRNH